MADARAEDSEHAPRSIAAWLSKFRLSWSSLILGVFLGAGGFSAFRLLLATLARDGADSDGQFGITRIITEVKSELAAADSTERAHGRRALFDVKSFDLDLSFVVHSKLSASGKPTIEVLSFENEASLERERIQHIAIHMTTTNPDSGSADVALGSRPSGSATVVGPVPPVGRAK